MTHHLPQAKARKKLGIPEPVLEFKVKLAQRRAWTSKIFKTRGQLQRYLRCSRPDVKDIQDVYAFTNEKEFEILFCLWTCTDNCVAHEMYHAVAWWSKTKYGRDSFRSIVWQHDQHEWAAELLGDMVSQFWSQFTKAGFKRDQCWGWEKPKAQGFYLDRRIY